MHGLDELKLVFGFAAEWLAFLNVIERADKVIIESFDLFKELLSTYNTVVFFAGIDDGQIVRLDLEMLIEKMGAASTFPMRVYNDCLICKDAFYVFNVRGARPQIGMTGGVEVDRFVVG